MPSEEQHKLCHQCQFVIPVNYAVLQQCSVTRLAQMSQIFAHLPWSAGIPEIYVPLQGILCGKYLCASVWSAQPRGWTTEHPIYGAHIPYP